MRIRVPTTLGSPWAGYWKRLTESPQFRADGSSTAKSNICFDDAVCFDVASTAHRRRPFEHAVRRRRNRPAK